MAVKPIQRKHCPYPEHASYNNPGFHQRDISKEAGFYIGFARLPGIPVLLDFDSDGIPDDQNCPSTYNLGQADSDGDGLGDACDDPPVTSLISKIRGLEPDSSSLFVCRNRSVDAGQPYFGEFASDGSFDCIKAGMSAERGDEVNIQIFGYA